MRSFLGAVNYYRDMWPKQAHILSQLSDKSGEKIFCWTDETDNEFKQMKSILSADALMAYPNHNKPFHINTDASDYQMGAFIMQDEKPVSYWSCKLMEHKRTIPPWKRNFFPLLWYLKNLEQCF